MRMRGYVAWGAIAGMSAVLLSVGGETRGPGPGAPGESTTHVLGVVIDRVAIPTEPDGRAVLPIDRIMRGVLATLVGAAVVGAGVGGLIGWGIGRFRSRRRPTESGAASDRAT